MTGEQLKDLAYTLRNITIMLSTIAATTDVGVMTKGSLTRIISQLLNQDDINASSSSSSATPFESSDLYPELMDNLIFSLVGGCIPVASLLMLELVAKCIAPFVDPFIIGNRFYDDIIKIGIFCAIPCSTLGSFSLGHTEVSLVMETFKSGAIGAAVVGGVKFYSEYSLQERERFVDSSCNFIGHAYHRWKHGTWTSTAATASATGPETTSVLMQPLLR